MNRPIEFRAWNKESKTMLVVFNSETQTEFYIPNMKNGKWEFMQYTGLLDKNGVKIFEGDIIKGYGKPFDVYFRDGCFVGRLTSNRGSSWNELRIFEPKKKITIWEIVGNIHQNPELLHPSK